MNKKNKISAEIDGVTFNIIGDEEERYMNFIASYIDKGIKEYTKNPKLSKTEGIILLALNLKDEVEKQKKKFEEYKANLDGEARIKKLEEYDKLSKENEEYKALLKEKDELIEKYKKVEEYSSKRLKEEAIKFKEVQEKLQAIKGEDIGYNTEIRDLEKKLAIQEGLNLERNKEIVELKNLIRALKEELKKFEK